MKIKLYSNDGQMLPENSRLKFGYYDSNREFTTLYHAANLSDLQDWTLENLSRLKEFDIQEMVIYWRDESGFQIINHIQISVIG